jgi:SAM-dependent methyltransferase
MIHFITYGSNKFTERSVQLCKDAQLTGWFSSTVRYDSDSLDDEFNKKFSHILNQPQIGGYGIWRPYIIKKRLTEINENDILIYLDAGCTININGKDRFYEYIDMIRQSNEGIISFQMVHKEKYWTTKQIFDHFNISINSDIANSGQILDGILIMKNNDKLRKIIDIWHDTIYADVLLFTDYYNNQHQIEGFKSTRHEQSILSVIRKINGSIYLEDETYFIPFGNEMSHKFPFWATRYTNSSLKTEIISFQNLWKGGFKTGYSEKRNQQGIEDYLQRNMAGKYCLEIGCGGGQWSKYIYNLGIFDKIYCIDVLSEEHNNFWNYVGHDKKNKIEYIQVDDFSLKCIPDNMIDYVFSYDVFCHISYSGQDLYLKNLYSKCKTNCKLCIMYADPEKYLLSEPENKFFVKMFLPGGENREYSSNKDIINTALTNMNGSGKHITGQWYWIGINKFVELCNTYNYKVISKDLNIDKTNPITLFTKL